MLNILAMRSKIWHFLIVSSIVLTLFLLAFNLQSSKVQILWLLPVTYFFSLVLTKKMYFVSSGIASVILKIVFFCRYIMVPLLWGTAMQYTDIDVPDLDYNSAVFLMAYELIVVSLAIKIYFSLNKRHNIVTEAPISLTKGGIIIFIVIVLWGFFVLKSPILKMHLFNFASATKEDFGLVGDMTLSDIYGKASGVALIIFSIGLIFIYVQIITLIARVKKYPKLKLFFILVACILYISCVWSNGYSVSRWNLIIGVLFMINVLYVVYPLKKNVINICGASLIAMVIVLGSVLKLMSFGKSDSSVKAVYEYYFNAEFYDEYFSGVVPVANGIKVYEAKYQERTPKRIVVDCFGTFPYATKLFGVSDMQVTEKFYHNITKRTELIMPNISISLFQFGWVLSPIYSVVFCLLALWFDNKNSRSVDLYTKLFYIILTFWCSIFMAINVDIICNNLWPSVFGLWLVMLNNKIYKNDTKNHTLLLVK